MTSASQGQLNQTMLRCNQYVSERETSTSLLEEDAQLTQIVGITLGLSESV